MATPAHLDRVDALLADPRPHPPEDTDHPTGYCGPGYRVEELSVSREFWDDPDAMACDREHDLAQGALEALAEVFTARWGRPYEVDLFSYLRASFDAQDAGYRPAEPVGLLCQQAVTLHVWPLPGAERWLGLCVGQGDKELPVVLSAALADGPAPAPTAPDPAPDPAP
ncbi:hypothetical protein ACFWIQ_08900 [Kitasatospora sp. NPDC127059]|uniref:hypothetical protein n=1 Tax=unclassified Kitasatospora TaxID=2633591 RepID=UPI003646AF27